MRTRLHPILEEAFTLTYVNSPRNSIAIRGKFYDVSEFEHPGGQFLIEACSEIDATLLFETHHLNANYANRVLDSLPCIGSYKIPKKWDFTLYDKMRAFVFETFSTKSSRRHNDVEAVLWSIVATASHVLLLCSIPFTLAWGCLCVASAIINTICGGIGHNGLHQMKWTMVLLDWNGLSSYEWFFEHIASHHMHVNTFSDHDCISMRPFLRWIPSDKQAWFGKKGKHLIYVISEIAVAFNGTLVHRMRWSPLKCAPSFMKVGPYIFLVRAMTCFIFHGIVAGTATLCMTLALAGYYFSNIAHLNHVYSGTSADFALHQLMNTKDIDAPRLLFLNLDRQTLHHLFPTVDHYLLDDAFRKSLAQAHPEIAFLFHRHGLGALNKTVNRILAA